MNTLKHSALILICLSFIGCASSVSKQNAEQTASKITCEQKTSNEAVNVNPKIIDGNDLIAFAEQYAGLSAEAQEH